MQCSLAMEPGTTSWSYLSIALAAKLSAGLHGLCAVKGIL